MHANFQLFSTEGVGGDRGDRHTDGRTHIFGANHDAFSKLLALLRSGGIKVNNHFGF